MKRPLFWLGILLVISPGPAILTAGNTGQPDYYPLKPGTKWHFQTSANGVVGQMQFEIEKIDVINGESLALLKGSINGMVVATEHLTTNRHGIMRYRVNGMEAVPPLCVLKYPVKAGDSWGGDFKVGGEKASYTAKVGKIQEIQVPAGKFKAASVTITVTTAGAVNATTTYWFAPDVGMVKQTVSLMGQDVTLELQKLEKPK